MAAMLVNNGLRLEETLMEELELETQASYIIFGTVAGIFLLYCVFLTWFSITAADEVNVDFLCKKYKISKISCF